MFNFLFASYKTLGSTLTTAMSFLTNNLLNVYNYKFIFKSIAGKILYNDIITKN